MSNRLPEVSMLTAREREVVHLLVADTLSNKEIAKRLGLTEGTVKLHLSQVYRKLGVKNRTAVVATFVIKLTEMPWRLNTLLRSLWRYPTLHFIARPPQKSNSDGSPGPRTGAMQLALLVEGR